MADNLDELVAGGFDLKDDQSTILPEAREELRMAATMIRTWIPEVYPANELGQVHFVRAVMASVAETIDRYLANPGEPLFDRYEKFVRRVARMHDGEVTVAEIAKVAAMVIDPPEPKP